MLKIKYLIFSFLLIILFSEVGAQNSKVNSPTYTIGANAGFNFSSNGNTYGLILDISKVLATNSKGTILVNAGIQEDFQVGGFWK